MDKHIEVEDRHQVNAKTKGQVKIKICYNNGGTFIATLHDVLFAPDIWYRLFSIIVLMNSGNASFFHKGL